jgi:hypothetical protein
MARKQPVEEAYLIQLTEKGNIFNDPQPPQKHANSSILLTFLKSLKISVPFALFLLPLMHPAESPLLY